jgi:hypothetical protein
MKRYYRLKGEFRGISLATKKRQSKQTNTRSPVPACTVSNALNTCFIHLFIVQSLPRFPETTEPSEHTHEMDNIPLRVSASPTAQSSISISPSFTDTPLQSPCSSRQPDQTLWETKHSQLSRDGGDHQSCKNRARSVAYRGWMSFRSGPGYVIVAGSRRGYVEAWG